ncbi:FecR family protein [Sphingobacterium griseoflavum]|uniref:FecR family protein n=1 Tax=Sphingobacterium griseoflavum TaxID=1474952 RepID=A0ABQ3HVV4_9SPHI|nr:FecR domain-containing protein [Sphingobacterium griseoflavum]GHE31134.1 hypothetical protein GCM10017764_12750 [Sphingobacterium griseoflavum]
MPKEIASERLKYLSRRWIDQTISPEERAELHAWYHDNFNDSLVEDMDARVLAAWQERAFVKLQNSKRRRQVFPSWGLKSTAAAAVVLLGFGLWWFAIRRSLPDVVIHPGRPYAILYDERGKEVAIDSIASEQLVAIGGAQWKKSADGSLLYVSKNDVGENAATNIRTPKGGEIKVQLPDGTLAFLNADSRLQLSRSFGAGKREVQLIGEAYFEVQHDASRPFLVHTTSSTVRVLGTHFNVRAYPAQPAVETTLASGSVALKRKDNGLITMLRPGEQGSVTDAETRVQSVDLKQVLAWKNGDFVFEQETLNDVMQELARWYDISYDFEDHALMDQRLWGILDRQASFEDMLEMLNASKVARFEQQGRRVHVKY